MPSSEPDPRPIALDHPRISLPPLLLAFAQPSLPVPPSWPRLPVLNVLLIAPAVDRLPDLTLRK